MKILGGKLSRDNFKLLPPYFRLAQGLGVFWSMKDIFLNKVVPLNVRMAEYVKRVQPVALYGAASWVWCPELFEMLRKLENVLLRRMLAVKRRAGEDFVSHMQRAGRWARGRFHQLGHFSLCTLALKRIFFAAGAALAEFRSLDVDGSVGAVSLLRLAAEGGSWQCLAPSRCMVAGCSLPRDKRWWRITQAAGETFDTTNLDNWRRHKPGWPTQWEDMFVKTYGTEWKSEAILPSWGQSLSEFIGKAYHFVKRQQLDVFHRAPALSSKNDGIDRKKFSGRVVICVPVAWSLLSKL